MTSFGLALPPADAVERIPLAGSARRHSRICNYRRCNQRTEPGKQRKLIAVDQSLYQKAGSGSGTSRCRFMVALAAFVLLPMAAQAQAIPHRGYWGPGLSTEDKQLLLEERGSAKCCGSDKDRELRIVEQSADKQFGQVLHTPGVPLMRQDLSLCPPSNRHRQATSTQLQSHLVPYAGRRMENQKLTAAAVPLPNVDVAAGSEWSFFIARLCRGQFVSRLLAEGLAMRFGLSVLALTEPLTLPVSRNREPLPWRAVPGVDHAVFHLEEPSAACYCLVRRAFRLVCRAADFRPAFRVSRYSRYSRINRHDRRRRRHPD